MTVSFACFSFSFLFKWHALELQSNQQRVLKVQQLCRVMMETYVPHAETWCFQQPLWPALLVGMRRKVAFVSAGSHCKMCHVLSMLLVPYHNLSIHGPSSSFLLLWQGENISFRSQRALKNEFLLLSGNSPLILWEMGDFMAVLYREPAVPRAVVAWAMPPRWAAVPLLICRLLRASGAQSCQMEKRQALFPNIQMLRT